MKMMTVKSVAANISAVGDRMLDSAELTGLAMGESQSGILGLAHSTYLISRLHLAGSMALSPGITNQGQMSRIWQI